MDSVERDDLSLLEQLGLPTQFSSSKPTRPSKCSKKKKKKKKRLQEEDLPPEEIPCKPDSRHSGEYSGQSLVLSGKKALNKFGVPKDLSFLERDSPKNQHRSFEEIEPSDAQDEKKPESGRALELEWEAWDPQLNKYWYQRYRLFSRFDQGIILDREGWYSVTPEVIAEHIASRCAGRVLVDAFCGVGGNTIQFARACDRVIAVDIDPNRLLIARHNCWVYGVAHKVEFVLADFTRIFSSLRADVVFLGPPWGGPNYTQSMLFDIDTMLGGLNGSQLFAMSRCITPNIAFCLPKNVDKNQILGLVPEHEEVEIENNFVNLKHKMTTAYFGNLVLHGRHVESTCS
jgi:trimethylguanosine synthase